jgi:N-acetylglucosamine kinase-like BadF-type ATPase
VPQPQGLIAAVYRGGRDRADLAALAPLVVEAAQDDAVAARVVEEGAQELARAGAAVAGQLGWDGPVPLALAGGLLLGSAGYRERVLGGLRSLGVQPGAVARVEEPARGALQVALSLPAG